MVPLLMARGDPGGSGSVATRLLSAAASTAESAAPASAIEAAAAAAALTDGPPEAPLPAGPPVAPTCRTRFARRHRDDRGRARAAYRARRAAQLPRER